jgi:hypothetical protein
VYDYQLAAADRRIMCEKIAGTARERGLDANWEKVNRQYRIWLLWYRGQLATGYLIRQTGVKRRDRS